MIVTYNYVRGWQPSLNTCRRALVFLMSCYLFFTTLCQSYTYTKYMPIYMYIYIATLSVGDVKKTISRDFSTILKEMKQKIDCLIVLEKCKLTWWSKNTEKSKCTVYPDQPGIPFPIFIGYVSWSLAEIIFGQGLLAVIGQPLRAMHAWGHPGVCQRKLRNCNWGRGEQKKLWKVLFCLRKEVCVALRWPYLQHFCSWRPYLTLPDSL